MAKTGVFCLKNGQNQGISAADLSTIKNIRY
jgi:hypothetical protein